VSLDVFSGEERYLSKHFTNHLSRFFSEAQNERSPRRGVAFLGETKKHKKGVVVTKDETPNENEKENDGVLRGNRVCVLCVLSLSLFSLNAHVTKG